MAEPILQAGGLLAAGKRGRIFGPVDLTLWPRQVCVVHGPTGSGKSALLLALTGRLREATGSLTIDGIDAMRDPYRAMQLTGVARLGDYVNAEDRLTLAESVTERAYLENIPLADANERVAQMQELVGIKVDETLEFEQLSAMERAVISVALVMLRPTRVIVLDDADLLVPHQDQPRLFELLQTLLMLDDATLIASTVDDDTAPAGAVVLELPRNSPTVAPATIQPTREAPTQVFGLPERLDEPTPPDQTDQPESPDDPAPPGRHAATPARESAPEWSPAPPDEAETPRPAGPAHSRGPSETPREVNGSC